MINLPFLGQVLALRQQFLPLQGRYEALSCFQGACSSPRKVAVVAPATPTTEQLQTN
jgi:hypothetical protein